MMSKSKSPLARGLRVLYVLPLVCLGLGLQARTVYVPVDKDSEKIDSVVLALDADGKVDTGSTTLDISEVGEYLKGLELAPGTSVKIVAPVDVKMEVVDRLRNEIRKAGGLKIFYATPDGFVSSPSLPPAPTTVDKKSGLEVIATDDASGALKRENICKALINDNDKIFFCDKAYQNDADILRVGKDFLKKHGAESTFLFRCDRRTSYGSFAHMQALLQQIYAEVREEKSQELYGKTLSSLSQEDLSDIQELFPVRIMESDFRH